MNDTLPDYAQRLEELHQALADDFRRIIARLPWQPHESIVDAGCGDGFFTGLLAERLSDKEIAERLRISPLTVRRHSVNLYQKLHVNSRRQAVIRAQSLGLLRPTP